jgi:hypothetical protein
MVAGVQGLAEVVDQVGEVGLCLEVQEGRAVGVVAGGRARAGSAQRGHGKGKRRNHPERAEREQAPPKAWRGSLLLAAGLARFHVPTCSVVRKLRQPGV